MKIFNEIFNEKRKEEKTERDIAYDEVSLKLLNKISKSIDQGDFVIAKDLAEIYSKIW